MDRRGFFGTLAAIFLGGGEIAKPRPKLIYCGNGRFIPNWKATGIVVGFSRDPRNFKLNKYVELRPA